jgi:hypothetical protein
LISIAFGLCLLSYKAKANGIARRGVSRDVHRKRCLERIAVAFSFQEPNNRR